MRCPGDSAPFYFLSLSALVSVYGLRAVHRSINSPPQSSQLVRPLAASMRRLPIRTAAFAAAAAAAQLLAMEAEDGDGGATAPSRPVPPARRRHTLLLARFISRAAMVSALDGESERSDG